jgi:4-alpha-glucanotransferase
MLYTRSAGILLHLTSLPGLDGIGELGPDAYQWIDFLEKTGCTLWQILPLGPTGYGDSPYQCFSAFAGNPLLISATLLLEEGLLKKEDLSDRPGFDDNHVDYGSVIGWKNTLLNRAFSRFNDSQKLNKIKNDFTTFCESQASWLNDFSLFMAIKENQGGISWIDWPSPLRMRDIKTLDKFRIDYFGSIENQKFRQFLFFRQWAKLKKYANSKGIKIIGDIPIFVSMDSADTWANPDLFYLDKNMKPTVVAGVPPDFFSPTGQLWGNPLYRWDIHQSTDYRWWVSRVKSTLEQVDIIRFDHFRGFAGYWEVKANQPTAEKGKWVKGPGIQLFDRLKKELNDLPIIVEDLGVITPDVVELRQQLKFPGMKILQFAFDEPENPFLPHNYSENFVAYTGSHDNDTSRGWYQNAPDVEKDFFRRYLARSGSDVAWDLIRAVWSSVAVYSLAPMQDFLNLGSEARMNTPGRLGGNWGWRMSPWAINDGLIARIQETNLLYDRLPASKKKKKG